MKNSKIHIILIVNGFTLLYSIVRYNFFKNVEWNQLPVYITNKAISWSALIFMGLAIVINTKHKWGIYKKDFGVLGLYYLYVHILLSLTLLNPEYFPKLYSNEILNWTGGLLILFGSAGFILKLSHHQRVRDKSIHHQKHNNRNILIYSTIFIALHIFFLGYNNWLKVQDWPGYMPPISLITFLISIAIILFLIKKQFQKSS